MNHLPGGRIGIVSIDLRNFLFREVDHDFKKGDYGTVAYSEMSEGELSKETIRSMIVQHFKINKKVFECRWNALYKSMATSDGVFFFSEDPPVHHKRFAIENFEDLQPRVTQDFLKFLNEARKRTKNGRAKNVFIPLFIGYRIPGNEVHWQVILVPLDHYPVQVYKNEKGNWEGEFISQKIMWAQTRNIAPKYFFGRGTLHEKLTTANILVIGVGAIGSMVATTFVRGGVTKISLIDHDSKEPENVCRSEYQFGDGLTAKVIALERQLLWISPFVDVLSSENFMDMSKIMMNMEKSSDDLKIFFEKFDYILDCTTDNDVAYILSTVDIHSRVVSMSITNHARELVCAVSPNVYRWTMDIFSKLSRSDDDLYHPTGCWSPTFKASYNDIATLVQFAIRQINQYLQNDQPLRNFYLSTSADDRFQVKTYQF